jgi:hypothetical protein
MSYEPWILFWDSGEVTKLSSEVGEDLKGFRLTDVGGNILAFEKVVDPQPIRMVFIDTARSRPIWTSHLDLSAVSVGGPKGVQHLEALRIDDEIVIFGFFLPTSFIATFSAHDGRQRFFFSTLLVTNADPRRRADDSWWVATVKSNDKTSVEIRIPNVSIVSP